jgi:hypothetical protein
VFVASRERERQGGWQMTHDESTRKSMRSLDSSGLYWLAGSGWYTSFRSTTASSCRAGAKAAVVTFAVRDHVFSGLPVFVSHATWCAPLLRFSQPNASRPSAEKSCSPHHVTSLSPSSPIGSPLAASSRCGMVVMTDCSGGGWPGCGTAPGCGMFSWRETNAITALPSGDTRGAVPLPPVFGGGCSNFRSHFTFFVVTSRHRTTFSSPVWKWATTRPLAGWTVAPTSEASFSSSVSTSSATSPVRTDRRNTLPTYCPTWPGGALPPRISLVTTNSPLPSPARANVAGLSTSRLTARSGFAFDLPSVRSFTLQKHRRDSALNREPAVSRAYTSVPSGVRPKCMPLPVGRANSAVGLGAASSPSWSRGTTSPLPAATRIRCVPPGVHVTCSTALFTFRVPSSLARGFGFSSAGTGAASPTAAVSSIPASDERRMGTPVVVSTGGAT